MTAGFLNHQQINPPFLFVSDLSHDLPLILLSPGNLDRHTKVGLWRFSGTCSCLHAHTLDKDLQTISAHETCKRDEIAAEVVGKWATSPQPCLSCIIHSTSPNHVSNMLHPLEHVSTCCLCLFSLHSYSNPPKRGNLKKKS